MGMVHVSPVAGWFQYELFRYAGLPGASYVTTLSEQRLINNNDMFSTRLVSASVALLLTATGTVGTNQNAIQPRHVAFVGICEIEGHRFVIKGEIGPASFFEELRSLDSIVFRNNVGEVRFFPDHVSVTIFIIGPFARSYERATEPDAQYMEGMKFNAEWKRGVELRPVKAFRQLTASVSEPPPFLEVLSPVRECWIYEFVIEDSEVPISDHLVLYVLSPENKRLARLSAYL